MNEPEKPTGSRMREQLVGPPAHPVDVVAEVRVRIQQHGVGGYLGTHELVTRRGPRVRAREPSFAIESAPCVASTAVTATSAACLSPR